jgi:transposase
LRQTHRAGEKLFVDYAGQTVPVTYPATGEIQQAQVFVAVLGASNYTYAEATWTQTLADWISAHVRALQFFGGVPELIVPDYVPWNIIGIMCPTTLCGRRWPKWARYKVDCAVVGT